MIPVEISKVSHACKYPCMLSLKRQQLDLKKLFLFYFLGSKSNSSIFEDCCHSFLGEGREILNQKIKFFDSTTISNDVQNKIFTLLVCQNETKSLTSVENDFGILENDCVILDNYYVDKKTMI